MEVITQLLGRLHPLLVHLPIGFIIFGLLLIWLDRKKKQYKNLIPIAFLWGGIIGVLTCISGYLLYTNEGFSFDSIKWHLWLGIGTTLFSFAVFFKMDVKTKVSFLQRIPSLIFPLVMLVLISFTGHLGGNITHGEDYLTEPLPENVKAALGISSNAKKDIVLEEGTWKDAQLYEDVIQPIFNNKCVSCHGDKKNKGELRMHDKDAILIGGENGEIIDFTNPEKSDLLVRIHLPKNDEDHMPPKEKSQLTKEEIALLDAWVQHGNDFEKSIGELGLQKALFTSFFPKIEVNNFPDKEVAESPNEAILAIRKDSIHVEKISKVTNYLEVSCINKPSFSNSDFSILENINKQIAVLDLGGTQVTDSIFYKLATLPNLTVLKLDNTSVTGNGIEQLTKCAHLKSINLIKTQFEDAHLQKLEKMNTLESVFLFDSKITDKAIQNFKNKKVNLDLGGYTMPKIARDTIVY